MSYSLVFGKEGGLIITVFRPLKECELTEARSLPVKLSFCSATDTALEKKSTAG